LGNRETAEVMCLQKHVCEGGVCLLQMMKQEIANEFAKLCS
jgi:hypothetical protein